MKYLQILALLVGSWFCSTTYADCSFRSGSLARLSVTIPSLLSFPRDIPIGTTIYDSGWRSSATNGITCNTRGTVTGRYTGNIGQALTGIPGYTDGRVYATPVPGVAMQLFWCNMTSCNPSPNNVTPPPNLQWAHTATIFDLSNQWWVRLIKVGDFDNQYSQPFNVGSSVSYSNLEVARITVTTSANLLNVTNRTCKVTTPSEFTVRLPLVNKSDFKNIGALHRDSASFSLDMMCERDIKVNYMFTALNPSNDATDVINNATGNNMATGVGIQLFKGGAESTNVLKLNEKQLHTTTGSTNDNFVSIPLTAKYYQLNENMTSGIIDTKAVFTITYE